MVRTHTKSTKRRFKLRPGNPKGVDSTALVLTGDLKLVSGSLSLSSTCSAEITYSGTSVGYNGALIDRRDCEFAGTDHETQSFAAAMPCYMGIMGQLSSPKVCVIGNSNGCILWLHFVH